MRPAPDSGLDRLAVALCALLASWWRQRAGKKKAAVIKTAAKEERDAPAPTSD